MLWHYPAAWLLFLFALGLYRRKGNLVGARRVEAFLGRGPVG